MLFIKPTGLLALCFCFVVFLNNNVKAVEKTSSKRLITVVNDVLKSHPQIMEAKAKLDQAKALAKAKGQPIYNPELLLDYESNVENTSTIGISQTIDWSNKRQASKRMARQNVLAAESNYHQVKQVIATNYLKSINQFQSSKTAADLNQQQKETLVEFVEIVKRRFQVGDINRIDLDFALLAASEIDMATARVQSSFYANKLRLESFQNFESMQIPELEVQLIQSSNKNVEKLLLNHPQLIQLRMKFEAAKAAIKLASSNKSADPTLSINAGKEGDQSVVNLGFSMPLFIRNNFSSEVDSAIANSVAVEQQYFSRYREALVKVKSTRYSLRLTLAAYNAWVGQNQKGLQERAGILKKLWQSGELSTTNYLLQIQQTLDTQIAASQLKEDLFNIWFDYLLASGQVSSWILF